MQSCPQCGSPVLIEHLKVMVGSDVNCDLRVEAERGAGMFFFGGTVTSPLEATVCGNCGHAELCAPDFRSLLEAVREAGRTGPGSGPTA